MSFHLEISDYWQAYLDRLPLSDVGREKLSDFVEYGIAQVDDVFRNDPANRLAPNKPYFRRYFLLVDTDAAGNDICLNMDFVVKDDTAPYGVLVIVWVDLVTLSYIRHQGR